MQFQMQPHTLKKLVWDKMGCAESRFISLSATENRAHSHILSLLLKCFALQVDRWPCWPLARVLIWGPLWRTSAYPIPPAFIILPVSARSSAVQRVKKKKNKSRRSGMEWERLATGCNLMKLRENVYSARSECPFTALYNYRWNKLPQIRNFFDFRVILLCIKKGVPLYYLGEWRTERERKIIEGGSGLEWQEAKANVKFWLNEDINEWDAALC